MTCVLCVFMMSSILCAVIDFSELKRRKGVSEIGRPLVVIDPLQHTETYGVTLVCEMRFTCGCCVVCFVLCCGVQCAMCNVCYVALRVLCVCCVWRQN
jgi:hypothetical protein